MRILKIRAIEGPNVYISRPIHVMRLDLEDLTEKESYEVEGFVDRLLAVLPGLAEHHCAKGEPGGFVERLHGGAYFGHTVEHSAIELQSMAGLKGNYGKTVYAGRAGLYDLIVEYAAKEASRYLLTVAVDLVSALVRGEGFDVEPHLAEARDIAARTELGPSARAIVEAARARGIPARRVVGASLVQLGYGARRKFVQAALTSDTSAIAVDVASDKQLTKEMLEEASVPVPHGAIVRTEEDAVRVLEDLRIPVAVKPFDGRQGKGVSLNLTTPEQVAEAFRIASEYSRDVLVEETLQGRDYRVLVVGGRVVAAAERVPARVVGDGARTIAALVDEENRNPLRGAGHDKPLTRLEVDDVAVAFLAKRGLGPESVPAAGEVVHLLESANLSKGGTARDVTDEMAEEVREVCDRAARIIGLDVCGVDLVMEDIARGETLPAGGIIELNAAPGLRMHLHPSEGRARDVGDAIVATMFGEGETGRIPIVSVTGTNGKTTVTRMVAHLVGLGGRRVGMTTTGGIVVGGREIARGDTTGPVSARTVLSDPTVEVAVLETARGGIMRRGLGYDWSDVGVITNVRADHIGQDGIESVDDILHVKSLVAERVREGGTLVLNADDERLAALPANPRVAKIPREVVFFSLAADSPVVERHRAAGGLAYFLDRDGWIVEARGAAERRLVRAASIPATMNGSARYQIENVMGAIAAARSLGVDADAVAPGIVEFRHGEHNRGRSNLYAVGEGYVLVDYGHNPDAFRAICETAAAWSGRRVTAVVGLPGDRDESVIREAAGEVARGFDRVFVKEDKDLRGRRPGETPAIVMDAIRAAAPDLPCELVADESEAVRRAAGDLAPGDVVVVFYERLQVVEGVLRELGAEPVDAMVDAPGPRTQSA